ncbi:hypothetical protein P3X46_009107 [Hevea brasiliensis]|uniref:Reverse transcriptase zinc-binding domain-containing protein n=1 Tax=Hevea brasiliensis TaxID=3981 RepID=A0ABQ9MKX9_HEVBR|nr:hypothetical protein P3X46_009107 [Hevea brasiliensis]
MVDQLHNLFTEGAVSKILQIPLSMNTGSDKLIWHYHNKGHYTVKTGYHMAMRLGEENANVLVLGDWNKLWRLHVPLKVKNFLWRVCRNILPTKQCLLSKGVVLDPHYDVCGQVDDIFHVLVLCRKASLCWQLLKVWPNPFAVYFSNFFMHILNNLDDQLCANISIMLWAL